jgi:hypothetical protein
MAALFAALHLLDPPLPLLIGERSGSTAWYSSWSDPQVFPQSNMGRFSASDFRQAHPEVRQVVENIAATNENISSQDYIQQAQYLSPAPNRQKWWDGFVFDLSALSTEKALQPA